MAEVDEDDEFDSISSSGHHKFDSSDMSTDFQSDESSDRRQLLAKPTVRQQHKERVRMKRIMSDPNSGKESRKQEKANRKTLMLRDSSGI